MNIVMVPGLWQGGWAWDKVALALRQAGHNVATPTLPGTDGPKDHRAGITLDDHARIIATIANTMDGPITLVGQSGGAFVIARACDFAEIEHCIYVDAIPPLSGEILNAALPGNDSEVPLPSRNLFGDETWDFTDQAWQEFADRSCPHPAKIVYDPITLDSDRLVRSTVIACTFPPSDIPRYPIDIDVVEFGSGHWPHITQPEKFAELLLSVISASTNS